jgi:hypothetical protein
MFVAGKKAARVLVLGISLMGAALGTHTMTEAAQGPGNLGAAAAAPTAAAALPAGRQRQRGAAEAALPAAAAPAAAAATGTSGRPVS